MIPERHRHCPASEGRTVKPGQGRTAAGEFLLDDPSPRFFDNRITTPGQLRQERGFAAVGTAGDDGEAVHADSVSAMALQCNFPPDDTDLMAVQ